MGDRDRHRRDEDRDIKSVGSDQEPHGQRDHQVRSALDMAQALGDAFVDPQLHQRCENGDEGWGVERHFRSLLSRLRPALSRLATVWQAAVVKMRDRRHAGRAAIGAKAGSASPGHRVSRGLTCQNCQPSIDEG